MATLANLAFDSGLPANVDAEKTILGAILLDNAAHAEAAEKLSDEDFSLDSHRRIFLRMTELIDAQKAVDIITLANELSRLKEIESIGGVAYLASLTEGLPRRPVIEEYIRIVKDKSMLRKLMLICSNAIARAANQGEAALDVLSVAETQLMEVSEKGLTGGLQRLDKIVEGSFGSIDNLYKQSREITGLATDFTEFDRMTSGLQKGELIIIAARPSMGKTALAINIAQNAAINHEAIVAVFSLEMSKESLLRRLMGICSMAIARAADQSETALEVRGAAESQLMEVTEKGLTHGFQSLDQIVQHSFGTIDNLYKQSREVTGLATDFTDFDRLTSGLQKGELIIIAARPSMGKTALAINIAQNAAINHNAIVAVFSLEMSKEALLRRMLASQAWVDQQKLQKGFLGREDHDKLQNALGQLVDSRIFIDDSAGISLAEMRAKARRLKQNAGGLDLVVVDYLQLMSATVPSSGRKNYENRTQEVSAISRGLKALSKELDVPVLALSQLSRAGVQRKDDHRPLLSDLRESGTIEQDADVVAFIHRESYYKHDEDMSEADKAKSEIIVAKQRNGPTDTVYLNFIGNFTRFDNPDQGHAA